MSRHDASHGHHHDLREGQSHALKWSLIANAMFMIVEFVGGIVTGSLALLADAGHMLSDVAALTVALVAHRLLLRPPSDRHTYGLQRAEVVGAQLNSLILLGLAGWLVFESVRRFQNPTDVEGGGVAVVAFLGLLVNAGSALLLHRHKGSSLNLHGAFLHMTLDALGSVVALAAGLGIFFFGEDRLDAGASLLIALLIVWSAWDLLRDSIHVLLEGTPKGIDRGEVERSLTQDPAVESVHHIHVWNLASDVPALSAHVVVADESTLHEAQLHSDRLKEMLRERFGIEHSTLELECHACEPVSSTPPT